MIPVLFINCKSAPFIDDIIKGNKIFETRSINSLRSLVGKRVLICQTGKGKSLVRCSARIVNAFPVSSFHEWDMFREYTRVRSDSPYEWKPDTKKKWLYELSSVIIESVPFHPAEGVRHGRVWMEYNGKAE